MMKVKLREIESKKEPYNIHHETRKQAVKPEPTKKNPNKRVTITSENFKSLDYEINFKNLFKHVRRASANPGPGGSPAYTREGKEFKLGHIFNHVDKTILHMMTQMPKIKMISSSRVNRRRHPTYLNKIVNNKWYGPIQHQKPGFLFSQWSANDNYDGWAVDIGQDGRSISIYESVNSKPAGFERTIDLNTGKVIDFDHNQGRHIREYIYDPHTQELEFYSF